MQLTKESLLTFSLLYMSSAFDVYQYLSFFSYFFHFKRLIKSDRFPNLMKQLLKHHYVQTFYKLLFILHYVCIVNEPRYEKTGFLHMRKQRRRSASR